MMYNLNKFIENAKNSFGYDVSEAYGWKTSYAATDFVGDIDFHYDDTKAFNVDDKMNTYADENVDIYYEDLAGWLVSGSMGREYVNDILKGYVAGDSKSKWDIFEIIRMAQCMEVSEALHEYYEDIVDVVVAKYLQFIGYTDVKEDVLEEMMTRIDIYDNVDLEALFEEVLKELGYDTKTCGIKQVA